MVACAVPHARAPSAAVGALRVASRRRVASRASRRGFLARADANATRRASEARRPEGDLETWTLRARAAAFACVASAVLVSGAAAEPAVASGEAMTVAKMEREDGTRTRTNNENASSSSTTTDRVVAGSTSDIAPLRSGSSAVVPRSAPNKSLLSASPAFSEGNEAQSDIYVAPGSSANPPTSLVERPTTTRAFDFPELLAAAAKNFIKPLLGEFGAAVVGFGAGALLASVFFGYRMSQKSEKNARAASRAALADLSALDESEIQDLIGELPAWLAFRDVERGGWVSKVLAAAWPYLDVATSDVIVKTLDPILTATRPSFLTALRFETFSFGKVPAKIEGVKTYETKNDGAVEIDLSVFWDGDPDVVLGVRAAQDALSVPVSLTEFECAFTLRLIFAPLMGVFPCFGALTVALVDEPRLDFDLRVVGGDVTLVPGLKESLRTYIKALIASWMVWPRCITVAIPGTGYELPSEGDDAAPPRAAAGLLHVQFVGHDGRATCPGDVGLSVRDSSRFGNELDLRYGGQRRTEDAETRVKALPGGGALSSREVTLPVEDPETQLLCVRWYSRPVDDDANDAIDAIDAIDETPSDGGEETRATRDARGPRARRRAERLTGEASIVLEELMRQAPEARETLSEGEHGEREQNDKNKMTGQWGPVPVAAELEAPAGADITRVRGDAKGGVRGVARRAARGVGGFFGKTAGGVVAGYRAVRSDGLRLAPIRDAAIDGWRERGKRDAKRFEAKDREALVRLSTEASSSATGLAATGDGDGEVFDADVASFAAADPGAGVVRLRVRYQPLDAAALSARAAKDAAEEPRDDEDETTKRTKDASVSGRGSGAFPRSLSAASRSVIDGAYASGEFISRSMGGSGDREDALETTRALLRERDREVAEMRVEKAALERKLRAEGGGKGIRAEEEEKESGKPSPREGRSSGSYSPGATKKNAAVSRPSARVTAVNADADAAAEREPAERSAAAADPRLAPLVAAARSAAAAVAEARARGVGDEALETAMAEADASVARAAAAVAEAARAAETDEELAELKRALRAKRREDEKGDASRRESR